MDYGSGRNSGVLHTGFYYSPDSLKAKFTRIGNKLLTEYCEAKKLALNKCGKLVVAKDSSELKSLDELLRRGRINDINLKEVSEYDTNYAKWEKPGIAAQLLDISKKKLEMDFVIKGDDKSIHVLDPVSPAFICFILFSQHVVNEIRSRVN